MPNSSFVSPRLQAHIVAMASATTSITTMDVVGARERWPASLTIPMSTTTSDMLLMGESGLDVMDTTLPPSSSIPPAYSLRNNSAVSMTSRVFPDVENTSRMSPRVAMPMSPCDASAGCR